MKRIEKIPDLVEVVKDSIFDGILTGVLKPGDKLQQQKLAEKLGVSRQPISHALRMLQEQGILTRLDARSLTVAEPDMNSVMQMLAVRKELDSFAAETAAQKIATDELSKADKLLLAEINKLVKRNLKKNSVSVKQGVMDDIRFHELIRTLSGNPFIHESLTRYVLHHNRFIYLMTKEYDDQIWIEHETIITSIMNGDAAKAKEHMRYHIARGTAKLNKHCDKA